MNNADDILKKILLNMRYDPKKTIKEQSSISEDAKKSDPGNPSLDEHKVISCLDGTEYVSPTLNVVTKFEPMTSQAWTDWQTRLVAENKENDLTACKYQATIKVQQKRTELSYDDEVLDCINFMYQLHNNKPMFCAIHFSMFDIEYFDGPLDYQKLLDYLIPKPKTKGKGVIKIEIMTIEEKKKYDEANRQIYLFTASWFKREYKKYQENNSYLTKEPYETETERNYSVWRGTYYAPFVMDSIIEGEKDLTITNNAKGSAEINNDQHFLPLTNAEKWQLNDNPLTKKNEFKNGGKYICKNRDKSMVNLRTSAEVNTDTGFFDPTDNYINWSGDEIIGEYLGEKWSYIQYGTSSLLGGVIPNEKVEKWKKSLNDNDVIEIWKSLGGSVPEGDIQRARYTLLGILNSVVDGKPTLDMIPKKYRDSIVKFDVSHKWYQVKFLKPYKDQTDGQTYDNGWVRTDNVNFCLPSTDKDPQTNYLSEQFKRIPMKALQDPPIYIDIPAPFGLGIK